MVYHKNLDYYYFYFYYFIQPPRTVVYLLGMV